MPPKKKNEETLPLMQDQMPKPEKVEVPEPTLIDVMRELKTLYNDVNVAFEAVKALGADVIENNNMQSAAMTDLGNQLQELQRAFITTVPERVNTSRPAATPAPSPAAQTQTKTLNLPQISTWPISEESKKNVVIEEKVGVGTIVRTKTRIQRDDWDKLNTFLRALGMKWTSIKEQKIYEWRPS